MPNYVQLRELLTYPSKYVSTTMFPDEDLSHIRIVYTPDDTLATFQSSITGVLDDQNARPERNHIWHPFLFNEMPYLISEGQTTFRLKLRGKQGYNMGTEALHKYARLYCNARLKAYGIALDEEKFNCLSPFLQTSARNWYWLATKFSKIHVHKKKDIPSFGLKYVDNDNKIRDCELYSNYDFSSWGAMRPVVCLPHNILIDISRIQMRDIGEPASVFTPSVPQRTRSETSYLVKEDVLQSIANKAASIEANDILAIIEQIKQNQI